MNWLEYKARWVAGSLRPEDAYYIPYDDLLAKSHWGKQVLEQQNNDRSGMSTDDDDDDDNDDEEENLEEVPWLVWDRAESAPKGLSGMLPEQFGHQECRQS